MVDDCLQGYKLAQCRPTFSAQGEKSKGMVLKGQRPYAEKEKAALKPKQH